MLGHELGVPVVDVFLVQGDGTGESALYQLPGILRVDNPLIQRAVLPLVVFPAETLHVQGPDTRPDQVGLDGPAPLRFSRKVLKP